MAPVKPSLRVVPATDPGPAEKVRQRLRKTKPATMLQCNRCAGREVIEAKSGVLFKDGKPSGGTKVLLCALCLLKGERVVLA
jgi:hypothetical protein